MKQIDPTTWLDLMKETAPRFANAKAERVYLEEYRKSLKAILMKASQSKTSVAQEADAYADPTYIQHIQALKIAVHGEESLRWKLVTAQTAIDIWRSQESSNRMIDKAAS
jgi:hypothetical protein